MAPGAGTVLPPRAVGGRLLRLTGAASAGLLLWSFVGGLAYLLSIHGSLPLATDPLAGARERWRRGDRAGAIRQYQMAARLEPLNVPAHTELGDLLLQSGRYDEASEVLQGALRLRPGNDRVLAGMGDVRRVQGRQPEAIQLYEQSLAARADQPAVLNNLGTAFAALGDFDRAILAFAAALKVAPDAKTEANLARARQDKARSQGAQPASPP